jgi:enoyl-CoA hydratase/carnithine racemase
MDYQDIIVARGENRIEVTLNRPDKLNALREQTAAEIMQALGEAEGDRAIRSVIVAGAGRAFCTGLDTSESAPVKPGEEFDFYRRRRRGRKVNQVYRFLLDYTKPIIAAVEGFALGGGLELALVADIIVAGDGAQLGLPECRIGLMPGAGGTQLLPRLVGRYVAKELIFTGRRLTAAEAKELRLVNHVVPRGEALAKAREIADAIVGSAPLSVMWSKIAVDRGLDMALHEGLSYESDLSFFTNFTEDKNEGLTAFREKRAPQYRGQ